MASSIIAAIPGLGDAAGSIIKGAGIFIKCEKAAKVGKAVSTTCRMIGAVAQTGVNVINFAKAFRSVRKEYRETGHVSFLNGANAVLSGLGVIGGIAHSVNSVKNFNKMRSSLSSKRISKSGSVAEEARNWQLNNGGYGRADDWSEVMLKKGDIVWAGEPGQSNFYTTNRVAEMVGTDATKLYEGLQVGKGSFPTYRPGFTMYEVQEDITVAYSKALANNQISAGGFEQYYIPNYENVLKPILIRIMENR